MAKTFSSYFLSPSLSPLFSVSPSCGCLALLTSCCRITPQSGHVVNQGLWHCRQCAGSALSFVPKLNLFIIWKGHLWKVKIRTCLYYSTHLKLKYFGWTSHCDWSRILFLVIAACLFATIVNSLSREVVGVVNVCICLLNIFWSTPLVPMSEESALLGIILSGGLIACRFQTIHQGCNYAEQLKTDFCHSRGGVTSHEALTCCGDARGQCCMSSSLAYGPIY